MSTFATAKSCSRKLAVVSAMPSVSSPASSSSVFAPRMRMDNVLKAVPTLSGFWTTVFAPVINAIDSSNVLFAAASEEAERVNASPIPPDEIAKRFPTSLNLSTIEIALSADTLNAVIVEIILCVASPMLSISSPTTEYIFATLASSCASAKLYPNRAKSAVDDTISLMVEPSSFAVDPVPFKNLSYVSFVSSVTFFNSVIAESISFTVVNIFLIAFIA